jgi:putative ABC transport system ATP-binding protein
MSSLAAVRERDRAPVLCLRGICKSYRRGGLEVPVLRGVDLDVEAGEYVAILGPSGAGKSTLLHVIGMLTRPTSGVYELDGVTTTALSLTRLAELRCRNVGFIFQDFALIDWCSSLYNVALPLMNLSRPKREREQLAGEWLEKVGLGHRLHHLPREMSGGEQQRVAIARALVAGARVILADEATGSLDQARGAEILELFDGINAEGRIILHVTHSLEVAARAQRSLTLVDGRFRA